MVSFASLYRRERPLGLGVIKQAQAIERIVPRAFARTTRKWLDHEILSERRTNDDPILKDKDKE